MLGHEVICVRCINCSNNNVAKGIRLLDKKAIFVYKGNLYKQDLLQNIFKGQAGKVSHRIS